LLANSRDSFLLLPLAMPPVRRAEFGGLVMLVSITFLTAFLKLCAPLPLTPATEFPKKQGEKYKINHQGTAL
jgi:hypothetical protein